MSKLAVLEASSYLCDSIFNLTGPALMFSNIYRQLQITPVCALFNWSTSSSSRNKLPFILSVYSGFLCGFFSYECDDRKCRTENTRKKIQVLLGI